MLFKQHFPFSHFRGIQIGVLKRLFMFLTSFKKIEFPMHDVWCHVFCITLHYMCVSYLMHLHDGLLALLNFFSNVDCEKLCGFHMSLCSFISVVISYWKLILKIYSRFYFTRLCIEGEYKYFWIFKLFSCRIFYI